MIIRGHGSDKERKVVINGEERQFNLKCSLTHYKDFHFQTPLVWAYFMRELRMAWRHKQVISLFGYITPSSKVWKSCTLKACIEFLTSVLQNLCSERVHRKRVEIELMHNRVKEWVLETDIS